MHSPWSLLLLQKLISTICPFPYQQLMGPRLLYFISSLHSILLQHTVPETAFFLEDASKHHFLMPYFQQTRRKISESNKVFPGNIAGVLAPLWGWKEKIFQNSALNTLPAGRRRSSGSREEWRGGCYWDVLYKKLIITFQKWHIHTEHFCQTKCKAILLLPHKVCW